MAKTKQQKKDSLDKIGHSLENANSAVFCAFNNLAVNEDRNLRTGLTKEDVFYQVVKKTLLERILLEKKVSNLPEKLEFNGNIGLATSKDEVAPAKIIIAFSKDKKDFKVVGGILNNVWVDANKIIELAKLPSRLELIAKTIGAIKSPINGFVNVLSGNLRGLVSVLNAIKNNK